MHKRGALRILLPLCILLVIIALLFIYSEDKDEIRMEMEADLVFKRTSLKFTQNGKKTSEFDVGLLMQNENENVIYFEMIDNARLYDEDSVVIAFSADKGIYYEKRDEFILTGNVRIYEGESEEQMMVVGKLAYDAKSGEAIIDERVEARLQNRRIRADRIVGRVKERSIYLSGNVVIEMDERERITCDEAVYSMDGGIFEIIGNAEMEFDFDV